ncbi:MAG: response regulator [Nitrospinae bacterium]|nr:response regulator [Nitrospinota bacterium]
MGNVGLNKALLELSGEQSEGRIRLYCRFVISSPHRRFWAHSSFRAGIFAALLFFAAVFIPYAKASTLEPLVPTADMGGLSVGKYAEYFEDKSKTLTLSDVMEKNHPPFSPASAGVADLGISESAFWLHFTVNNPTDQKFGWILVAENPFLEHVEVYEVGGDKRIRFHEGGSLIHADSRDVPYRKSAFAMTALPGTGEVYVKTWAKLTAPADLTFIAWGEKLFDKNNNMENLFLGLYYGLMGAMFLYNLLLFVMTRDRAYFYFSAYIILTILLFLSLNGFTKLYFFPSSGYVVNHAVMLLFGASSLAAAAFCRVFLDTKKLFPSLDRLLVATMVFSAVHGAITSFDSPFWTTLVKIGFVPAAFVPLLLLYAGVKGHFAGLRQARFYVLAWGVYMLPLFLAVISSYSSSARPVDFFQKVAQVGALVDVMLLSLALGDRIKVMREDKENAENALFREIEQKSAELEKMVDERTAQLKTAKETAENATKLKDKFVSLVSHDLRGPLGIAMGLLKLVVKDKKIAENSAKTSEMVEIVRKSMGGLLEMIDTLLNLSRFRTGMISVIKRSCSIKNLVDVSFGYYMATAEKKGVALINKVPREMTVLADQALLGEVLNNLVSNAVKFCRNGDSITVSTPDPLAVVVKDTGTGVSKKILPDLFRSEVKTSTVGTEGEGGTGLGLPYCKEIMAAHGGDLTVESEEGLGSAFTMRFPAGRPVVLVVDDQEIQRAIIKKHLLEMRDVEVMEACNGLEALDILKDVHVALLITDLGMPEMDGFELLRELRRNPPTIGLPIIVNSVASGSSGQLGEILDSRKLALELGADDFISKPVVPEDFIPRVARYIG